jgi:hypothetical protein
MKAKDVWGHSDEGGMGCPLTSSRGKEKEKEGTIPDPLSAMSRSSVEFFHGFPRRSEQVDPLAISHPKVKIG